MADDEAAAGPPGTGRLRAAQTKVGAARSHFRRWRRSRPFWGGLLIIVSGTEMLGTTQLSLGDFQVSIGLEGLQSILIPVILITAGILVWAMPVHRVFYGVIALVVALYSLVGVNLGGFLIGMLLGILGGSFAVAWSPREPEGGPSPDDEGIDDEATDEFGNGAWDDLQQRHDSRVSPDDSIIPGLRDDRGASTARLALAGAVAGTLIVAAIAPASATGPVSAAQAASGDCEPDPTPTQSPSATPDPEPTQSPSPDPSSTPGSDASDGSDAGLLETVVSTVTQIFTSEEDDCEPVDDPTEGPTSDPTSEPTDGPTAEPTDGPTGTPTSEPTGEPDPGDDETPEDAADDEQSDGTDELGLPEGFELPEDAELTTPQTLESEDLSVVAADPGRLTGSSISLTNLVFEGNVDLPTADGPLTVMKFTMAESVVNDFSLAADALGESLLTTTDELTIRGDVAFYTDRFVGWMLGFKWTFLPETPPPFTLPYMVFTDPEIRLVAVEADVLTAKPMNQRQVS